MKIVCITDIHGYLDEALAAIQKLEEKIGIKLVEDGEWVSDHKLVLNGDMFDRGSQNRESLRWALDNSDVYNIGNHEFFALFPDVTKDFMSQSYFENHGENGLYWFNMGEEERHRLIQAVAEGEITAAYKHYNYTYSHSGVRSSYPEIPKINSKLEEVGEKLLESHKEAIKGNYKEFEQTQREIVDTVETKNGKELRGKYPFLFDVARNDRGETTKGGIVWNRFQHLETSKKQVVGHTRGTYLRQKGLEMNPQWRKQALNINTIRDAVNGKSDIAMTIEDEEKLESHEPRLEN